MKNVKPAIIAFSICTVLSIVMGAFLLLNVRNIPGAGLMLDSGKQIMESVLEMRLQENNYLLNRNENALEHVRDKTGELRKLISPFEKSVMDDEVKAELRLSRLEEAINLYERLFDQFLLYHKAVEKSIIEIRNLEKRILAIIYSKMNPERGIIALQEIRIHEKGYLLYRNYPEQPDERSFEDMRKEAVSNLLIWAREDKRIEELMDRDNRLFNEILSKYESQDTTLLAMKRESGKIKEIAETFLEQGNAGLSIISRRCAFLVFILLIIWSVTAIPIIFTRFK